MVSLGKFLAISAFIGMKKSLNQINLSAQEARQTTNPKLNLIPYFFKKNPQTINSRKNVIHLEEDIFKSSTKYHIYISVISNKPRTGGGCGLFIASTT